MPPPAGDADAAAARADLRLASTTPTRASSPTCASSTARCTAGEPLRLMADRHAPSSRSRSASSGPTLDRRPTLDAGEVGYVATGLKNVKRVPRRRHHHRRRAARRPSRCPATARPSRWSSPASTRSTATTTTLLRDALDKLQLNDASLIYEPEISRRARLRLPLRLPRPAAHGDRPGAARARVRPRPPRHRAQRRVRGHDAPTAQRDRRR